MVRPALILITAVLAGCATCERHPIACSAVAGVVATSVALSISTARAENNAYRRPFYELKGSQR